MDNFHPFLASYQELLGQWQRILDISKDMEEKAAESPEVLRMIGIFKNTCIEFQNFQAKLDYFRAESSPDDLASHYRELRSDFDKIRACFAALVQSIHNYHKSREMAELRFSLPQIEVSPPSDSLANSSHDQKSNVSQMESSSILKNTPKKLIIALPNLSNTESISSHASVLREPIKPHIVSRQPAELIVILRVSKEYLNLNARPPINMEEEMRLSVLRHKKAEEDEAMKQIEVMKQAEAIAEAARAAAVEQAALHHQEAADQLPFDFDDPATWENCDRAIANDGILPPNAREPDMEEVRQALIAATKQLYLTDKHYAKASTIKRRVKKHLQLKNDFFNENGWLERADLIIRMAFQDAWVSLQPSTTGRPQYRRGPWTTIGIAVEKAALAHNISLQSNYQTKQINRAPKMAKETLLVVLRYSKDKREIIENIINMESVVAREGIINAPEVGKPGGEVADVGKTVTEAALQAALRSQRNSQIKEALLQIRRVLRQVDFEWTIRGCLLIVRDTLRSLRDEYDAVETSGGERSNLQLQSLVKVQSSAEEDKSTVAISQGSQEDFEARIEKLMGENKKLKLINTSFEKANNELISDFDSRENELTTLKEDLIHLQENESQLEIIKECLESSRNTTDKAFKILSSLKKNNELYKESVSQFKKELKACRAEREDILEDSKLQNEMWEKKYASMVDQNIEMEQKMAGFKRKLGDVIEDIDSGDSPNKRR
ncbi:hypothetical protein NHQ30_004447 [Ciborinia camelliae]|nr:hypothetical protein NHQ30_004447 [Ciborinia camelliae]